MSFCFTSFFSFRGNLLECISARGVTGSARHLCVCGSGLVAWLRTSTLILLRQVLKQNSFICIKFEMLLFHVLLRGSARNLRYSLANGSRTVSD